MQIVQSHFAQAGQR